MNLYNGIKAAVKKKTPALFGVLKKIKKPFQPLLSWIRFGPLGYETVPIALGSVKRKYFPNLPSKYSRVKALKDIHKGEKMFIVATGPSLTAEDLGKLKGHLSMGVNSIVLSYDHTDWRPTYYIAIDTAIFQCMQNVKGNSYDLWRNVGTDPGHIIVCHYFDNEFDLPEEAVLIPSIRSRFKKDGTGEIKFSDDCFLRVYESYTVMYSAIQLAVYMGCSEIYLLGADCNYTGTAEKDHSFNYNTNTDVSVREVDFFIAAYRAAKKYADAHGVKIFNSTRGGKLEVFPRVPLEEALKD